MPYSTINLLMRAAMSLFSRTWHTNSGEGELPYPNVVGVDKGGTRCVAGRTGKKRHIICKPCYNMFCRDLPATSTAQKSANAMNWHASMTVTPSGTLLICWYVRRDTDVNPAFRTQLSKPCTVCTGNVSSSGFKQNQNAYAAPALIGVR